MIQRKDSIAFMEFIKGKYDLNNVNYIKKLIKNMTNYEIEQVRTSTTFDQLWFRLWSDTSQKDYDISKRKFNLIYNGYILRDAKSNETTPINLATVIAETILELKDKVLKDTEWEYPKGRRNINETDMHCAFREFQEETGIPFKKVKLSTYFNKPYEEIYISMNNVRYRHIYYMAEYLDEVQTRSSYNPANKTQIKEVKDAKWFTLEEMLNVIKDTYIERKEVIQRIYKRLNTVAKRV
jgi:ADP-ribose pyrophosphatase YjhB (NUDIX family)